MGEKTDSQVKPGQDPCRIKRSQSGGFNTLNLTGNVEGRGFGCGDGLRRGQTT